METVKAVIQTSRPEACNFIKKATLAQVLSCKFCEISKNTFSYTTTLVAASDRLFNPGIRFDHSTKANQCKFLWWQLVTSSKRST